MPFSIAWSAMVAGDSHHLLALDPNRRRLYVGDGWGVAYASLSLRILDMADGAELAKIRTRHQQARAITFVGGDAFLATDSRLFQLSRADLTERRAWDSRVPKFTDTLAHENGKLFMANWLRPTAAIFDLDQGGTARLSLEPGLRALRRGGELLVYALRSGALRTVDLAKPSSTLLIQSEPGRWVTTIANRWLAVLKAGWKADSGGVAVPAETSNELVLHDLDTGAVHTRPLTRETVAIEGAASSPLLWLAQRGPGPSVLPSIVEQVELPGFRTVQIVAAPTSSYIAHVIPTESVVLFAAPDWQERKTRLSLARVT
jgi:hypothetical protein